MRKREKQEQGCREGRKQGSWETWKQRSREAESREQRKKGSRGDIKLPSDLHFPSAFTIDRESGV